VAGLVGCVVIAAGHFTFYMGEEAVADEWLDMQPPLLKGWALMLTPSCLFVRCCYG